MVPKCFGLRPSSGSLQLSAAKVILILKHSVILRRSFMTCVMCAVQSESSAQHTVHTPYWDMLPHHRITNYDAILLNVLYQYNFSHAQLQAP